MSQKSSMEFLDTPYTRARAISEGELMDVSKIASLAGFETPIAVSRRLWMSFIHHKNEEKIFILKKPELKILHVLNLLKEKIKERSQKGYEFTFDVPYLSLKGSSKRKQHITFKAISDRGDNCEPVLTLTLSEEN